LSRREFSAALDLFDRVGTRQFDDDGFEVGRHMFAVQRAEALEGLDRIDEAADVLLEVLVDQGVIDVHLGILVECLLRAERPLDELAVAIPASKAPDFLAQVLQLSPARADDVLEACVRQMDDARVVLATAATLARDLPLELALVWSARMREAGYATNCPLLTIATGMASPELRARAAATVVRAFGDDRGRDAFLTAYSDAEPRERETIRTETAALCPELLAAVGVDIESEPDGGGDATALPRVSIVMPCSDGAEATLRCLQSLQSTTDTALYEMILIDNGSTDATVQLARAAGPRFRVVRNEVNTGFWAACDQGVALATGDYVLLLDHETIMLAEWLEPLVGALDEDAGLGAVHAHLLHPDGDDNRPIAGGGLLARRHALVDLAMAGAGNGDVILRLQAAGWNMRTVPTPTTLRLVPGSLSSLQ
jgi:hypothetical protein